MANSNFFKTDVEPYVREQLAKAYNCTFKPSAVHLTLSTSGEHEFDAVSSDNNIVASIKSHAGKTKSGNKATGSYLACVAELYYLSLLAAEKRVLVLTDSEMYKLLKTNIEEKNRLAPGISLCFIELSDELKSKIGQFKPLASAEVSPLLPDEIS